MKRWMWVLAAGLLAAGCGERGWEWGADGGRGASEAAVAAEREAVVAEYLREHPETGVAKTRLELETAVKKLEDALRTYEEKSARLGRNARGDKLYQKFTGQLGELRGLKERMDEDIVRASLEGELVRASGMAADAAGEDEILAALENIRKACPEVFGAEEEEAAAREAAAAKERAEAAAREAAAAKERAEAAARAELERKAAKERAEAAARAELERKAAGEAGKVKTVGLPDGTALRLRWCPAGTFTMGSPVDEEGRDDDEVRHKVTLTKGFWLGETEITQGQWKAVMGTTVDDQARRALHDDSEYTLNGIKQTLRHWYGMEKDGDVGRICGDVDMGAAMYHVSWEEAALYCQRLTKYLRGRGELAVGGAVRLPTEAEWEYACRAGTTAALPSGEDIFIIGQNNAPALDGIAWYGGNSSVGYAGNRGWNTDGWAEKQYPGGKAGPRKVGQKAANAWGFCDMIGNVWEWCGDWYGGYPSGAVTDPKGPETGPYRVSRGGGWNYFARYCRSAYRGRYEPGYRSSYLGFRVLLAP